MPILRFKQHLQVELIEDDRVVLLSESDYVSLKGKLYCQLVPLLGGQLSTEEIITQLDGIEPAHRIIYALNRLKQRGYIVEADDEDSKDMSATAFWDMLHNSEERMGTANTVRVVDLTGQYHQVTCDTLSALDIHHDTLADLWIVLTDDYLHPELSTINHQAQENGKTWLPVKPMGFQIWLGPLFRQTEDSVCWTCLEQRLLINRPVERYVQQFHQRDHLPRLSRATLPTTIAIALNLLATETARLLKTGDDSRLNNRMLVFDIQRLETSYHSVVKRPQCSTCGTALPAEIKPPQLQSSPYHLKISAGQTLKRYWHHVSPITGIVPKLEHSLALGPLHVYSSGAQKSPFLRDWKTVVYTLTSGNTGANMDDTQAQVSALAESLERYCGCFFGDEPRITASYAEIAEKAIHPDQLQHYSSLQYETPSSSDFLPHRFDEGREIEWTPAWSLVDETFRYVPTAYCYFAYPDPSDYRYCGATSNGCAAGASLEDAIVRGFVELAERDAVAIWWHNRIQLKGVDIERFDEPYVHVLRQFLGSVHREFWVLDITNDLGIPVFVAVSRRIDKPAEDIALGYGAHLDPRQALRRALFEMTMTLEPVIAVGANGKDHYEWVRQDEIDWWQQATIANQPYLAPDTVNPLTTPATYPKLTSSDDLDDLRTVVNLMREKGFDMLMVDQTRPDIGLPVARVIVPGLRFYDRQYGAGRLYDIPVQLGWLDVPRNEADMNPFRIPQMG